MDYSMNRILKWLIVLAIIVFGWYLYKQYKDRYVIEEKIEIKKTQVEQLAALRTLGYPEDGDHIATVKQNIAQTEQEIDALQHRSWFTKISHVSRQEKVDELVAKTKDMIGKYKQQLAQLYDAKKVTA